MSTLLRWCARLVVCAACLQACAAPDGETATDANTWLSAMRSAHLLADGAERLDGGVGDAVAALREAVDAPVPAQVSPVHRRVVHQDLLYRLAGLELAAGRAEHALIAAQRGLALGRATDVFSANLLIVRGEALQGLGRDTEAALSYYEALEINRELLSALLDPGHPAAPSAP